MRNMPQGGGKYLTKSDMRQYKSIKPNNVLHNQNKFST